MKIKLRQLIDARGGLSQIMNTSMDFDLAERLSSVLDLLWKEMKDFEDTQKKLKETFVERENDAVIKDKGKAAKYNDAIRAALDREIEVEVEPIALETLRGTRISPTTLYDLKRSPFIIKKP